MTEFLMVVICFLLAVIAVELTAYVGLVFWTMVQEFKKPKNSLEQQLYYALTNRAAGSGGGCGDPNCPGCGEKKDKAHGSGGSYI